MAKNVKFEEKKFFDFGQVGFFWIFGFGNFGKMWGTEEIFGNMWRRHGW